jgi:DNA-binding beta-propeller fold protein YncE
VDPQTVAINSAGNVEVASEASNQLFEISPSGGSGAFSISNAASLNSPVKIAIDNRDLSTWVTDTLTNEVTHIDVNGVEIASSSPLPTGPSPLGVAIDSFGSVFLACSDQNSLTGSGSILQRYSPLGTTPQMFGGPEFTIGAGTYPFDVAIDNTENVWWAFYAGIAEYNGFFSLISPLDGYPSNPDNSPLSLAVDGTGRVLAANSNLNSYTTPGTVTVFSNNGTLLSTSNNNHGYSANGILPINVFGPRGVALDGSGNMWVAGKSGSSAVLVELIGVAAPVLTPLSAANYPNMLGMRPEDEHSGVERLSSALQDGAGPNSARSTFGTWTASARGCIGW